MNKLTAADLDDEDLEHLKDVELDKETLIQEHNENEINKAVERSRKIYQEANKALKYTEDKEQRVRLLEAWKEFEVSYYILLDFPNRNLPIISISVVICIHM